MDNEHADKRKLEPETIQFEKSILTCNFTYELYDCDIKAFYVQYPWPQFKDLKLVRHDFGS